MKPKMANLKGAACILGCSQVWLVKAIESGRVKCAMIFDPEEGRLIRRPSGKAKKSSQGLHFLVKEIEQYKVKEDGKEHYDFDLSIKMYPVPVAYTTKGLAKKLDLTYVRILAILRDGKKRLTANYYDDETGLLESRPWDASTRGKVVIFFEDDIKKLKIQPRGRPEITERNKEQEYQHQYYLLNRRKALQ